MFLAPSKMLRTIRCMALLPVVFLQAHGRKWNNTGKGTIAFEEAWTIPELLDFFNNGPPPPAGSVLTQLEENLLDIHNQRLSLMDATGVDYMVLSCASPCIQGISDPSQAESMAMLFNNRLAAAIANNTMRFGAFATMSMHDPVAAAAELERAVKELGFLGALLNDYQQSGPVDNMTLLFYDQPEYDVFWRKVEELDVPIYLHPRVAVPPLVALQYQHAIWLNGAAQEFTVALSTHVLGIAVNGIFDRFPKLKIIVGHLGERITSDLLRIDAQLQNEFQSDLPMNRTIASYWQTNLLETTSGNFATPLLEFHIKTIGLDRIMYSIDYPYVTMQGGQDWINKELPSILDSRDLFKLKRETAIRVLGLKR